MNLSQLTDRRRLFVHVGIFAVLFIAFAPTLAQASDGLAAGGNFLAALSADMTKFKKAISFGLAAVILVIAAPTMGSTILEGGKEVADGRLKDGFSKIVLALAIVAAAVILPAQALKIFGLGDAAVTTEEITQSLGEN